MYRKEAIRILKETKLCSPLGQAAYVAIADMEKQNVVPPVPDGDDEQDFIRCGFCKEIIGVNDDFEQPNYCQHCGQKLCGRENIK